jgi:hypothetical protein
MPASRKLSRATSEMGRVGGGDGRECPGAAWPPRGLGRAWGVGRSRSCRWPVWRVTAVVRVRRLAMGQLSLRCRRSGQGWACAAPWGTGAVHGHLDAVRVRGQVRVQVPLPWRRALVTSSATTRTTVAAASGATVGRRPSRNSGALSRAPAADVAERRGATLTLVAFHQGAPVFGSSTSGPVCPGFCPDAARQPGSSRRSPLSEGDYLPVEPAKI